MTGQSLRFLIGGMARSGTTVVQRLASELQGVWVPQETQFWRHAERLINLAPPPWDKEQTEDVIAEYLAQESSSELEITPPQVSSLVDEPAYLWDLFSAVVARLSPPDVSVLGEKTPDHLRWAIHLLRRRPELKLIGVVRDPRAVYRSHQTVPWGIRDAAEFSEKWIELSRQLNDCQRLFPDRVLAFRHEDVVQNPEETRHRIADFLGVPHEPRVGTASVQVGAGLFPEAEWWKRLALEEIRPRDQRWQAELSDDEIATIEWLALTEMSRWDYLASAEPREPAQLSTPAWNIRSSAARIAAQELPIDENTPGSWRQTKAQLRQQIEQWQHQAQRLAELDTSLARQLEHLKRQHDALSKEHEAISKERSALLADKAQLNEISSKLEADVQAKSRELNRLKLVVSTEETERLRAQRRYLVAESKVARLKARRWWKLAGILSRWRRQPWRVDRLVVDGFRLLKAKQQLPAPPDLRAIETQLAERMEASPSSLENAISAARSHFKLGEYELALAVIDEIPSPARESQTVAKLARDCYTRLGEVTLALREVNRTLQVTDDPSLRRQARNLKGRLQETETWWSPDPGGAPKDYQSTPGRVLHLLKESLPFFERGYTIRSHSTLLAQRLAGYDPVVVTSLGFPRRQGFTDFQMLDVVDSIPHHRLDLGHTYSTEQIPFDMWLHDQASMSMSIALECKPEIIQAGSGYRGYETALVGLSIAQRLDVPLIYEVRSFLEQAWTSEVERSESGEYYERRRAQELRCMNQADVVITIAEAMREELIQMGAPTDRTFVVPNVVDADRFKPRTKRDDLMAEYQLKNRPVLGYISNLGWREGIDNLIRAVGVMKKQGSDVIGLIVGDGPERERLHQLVLELGLERDVVFTDHVANEDIEDHYALIDVFVIPRVNDRASRLVTPLKPLEAMAMKVPLLVANLPALNELVAPPNRGMVFEPSNPTALAEAAQELLDSDALRKEVAESAYQWVTTERTLQSNADRYRRILDVVKSP